MIRPCPLGEGDESDRRARDRFPGAFLGDRAVDQRAVRQGQVQRLLDRALGPVETMMHGQVGLARGREDREAIALT